MKLTLLTTAAAVVALTGAAFTQSAKAQFVGVSGDLILSFADNVAADMGSTTNYEIDLGQFSKFTNATGTVDLGNINADLTSVYGSNYFTNSDITLGITGVNNIGATVNGVKNQSVFVSNPTTTPFPTENAASLGSQVGLYATIYNPAADTNNVPVAGTTPMSFKVPTANNSSFTTQSGKPGFSLTTTLGGMAPQLGLDILQPGTGSFGKGTSSIVPNGVFSLSSSGEVTFGATSAPEPSTYALMALGAGILVWNARRNSIFNS